MTVKSETAAVIDRPRFTGGDIIASSLRSGRTTAPLRSLGLLVIIFAFFSIAAPNFFSTTNVSSLLAFAVPAAMVAVGLTFVIALGEIDLSVASVAALSGIVFIQAQPQGLLVAFIATFATGVACGLFTGLATTLLGVPSLVSSLAMLFIAQGIAFVLASQPITGTRLDVTIFFQQPIGPVLNVRILLGLAVVVAAAIILGLTPLGRALYARGSNPRGVKSIGLPSKSLVIGAFSASGLLAAFAGSIIAIGLNSASPVVGGDLLLLAIAACLIGGSRLEGGTGSVIGTTLALIALLSLQSGMDQLGVSAYIQQVVRGAVVLIALLAASPASFGGIHLASLRNRFTRTHTER